MANTIQDVIDFMKASFEQIDSTVDGLMSGNPGSEVRGIVTAFMPTQEVIRQAAKWGANLIIAHEGVYYSHREDVARLANDPVYLDKRNLIKETGMAIYRLHDGWHLTKPDGIMEGLLGELGWLAHVVEHQPFATVLSIPAATVQQIAEHAKQRLGIPYIRVVGDLSMRCERIGMLAGYRGGGQLSIPLYEQDRVDLVIAGEGQEWEAPAYVRDAVAQGKQKAYMLLGHAESEEPGMKFLAERLRPVFPHIPVRYIPEKSLFQII